MGYGIITMRKISTAKMYGIQSHMNREHESRTNPDIDKDRSAENYAITAWADDLTRRIQDKIDALPPQFDKKGRAKPIRENAVRLCDFVITASADEMNAMTEDEQYQYFKDATKFLEDRYGKDNLLYSVVHNDEAVPHLHVGVIPIRENELNAKKLFTKKEMQDLQDDFFRDISEPRGFEHCEGGTVGLETLKYKRQQEEKRLDQLKEETKDLELWANAPENVKQKVRTLENGQKERQDAFYRFAGVQAARDGVEKAAKNPYVKASLDALGVDPDERKKLLRTLGKAAKGAKRLEKETAAWSREPRRQAFKGDKRTVEAGKQMVKSFFDKLAEVDPQWGQAFLQYREEHKDWDMMSDSEKEALIRKMAITDDY